MRAKSYLGYLFFYYKLWQKDRTITSMPFIFFYGCWMLKSASYNLDIMAEKNNKCTICNEFYHIFSKVANLLKEKTALQEHKIFFL